MTSNLSSKKAAAKRLVELRARATKGKSWIDGLTTSVCEVQLFDRLHCINLSGGRDFKQRERDAEYLVDSLNHAAQLAEDFLRCVNELEHIAEQKVIVQGSQTTQHFPSPEANMARQTLEKLGAG